MPPSRLSSLRKYAYPVTLCYVPVLFSHDLCSLSVSQCPLSSLLQRSHLQVQSHLPTLLASASTSWPPPRDALEGAYALLHASPLGHMEEVLLPWEGEKPEQTMRRTAKEACHSSWEHLMPQMGCAVEGRGVIIRLQTWCCGGYR